MNEIERYNFDLNGFLLVKGMLSKALTARCLSAVDGLEQRLVTGLAKPPSFLGHYNIEYRSDDELGIFYYENYSGGGRQIVVDDFLNASEAFDDLVAHGPTMKYVREFAAGPYWLTSSEIRFRHKGNKTLTHMGGPIDSRNRFEFLGRSMHDAATGDRSTRSFNLVTLRVIYALHDIPLENGPLCVVPGSHKSNFFSPYGEDPSEEPGMVGIPMEAGDALFFTENLRHGGFPNLMDSARRTLHLTIGPRWATSQSPAHWNDVVHVTPSVRQRYSEEQRALLPAIRATDSQKTEYELIQLKEENRRLAKEIAEIKEKQSSLSKWGIFLPNWFAK